MRKKNVRMATQTSAFGTKGRISHDSSRFYSGRMYSSMNNDKMEAADENPLGKDVLDKLFCQSSESMSQLPDNSIHLMITSPPYNVGKEYDGDLTLDEYRGMLCRVFKEVYRVLVVGGRACINVANLGRKPYIPLHSFIIEDMLKLGFFMKGEIIWNKAGGAGPSTAWGTWLSAKNPTLRDVHEYILVFSKGSNGRQSAGNKKSTMTRDEFMELTKSIWTFMPQPARAVGHPAPFPVELPLKLIKLYTFEGDVVLDPFIGSGTTAIASIQSKRHFIGYDINKEYCTLAEKRINQLFSKQGIQ